jgi:hypothetical protein
MTVSRWQAGTIYLPGALVIPSSVAGASQTVIPNADFESGDTGWTKGTGWAINTTSPWAGTYSAEFTGTSTAILVNSTKATVAPGKSITASVFIRQGTGPANDPSAAIILEWYDAGDSLLSTSYGNTISDEGDTIWKESAVSAVAPSGAAKVSVGVTATGSSGNALYVDNFRWNYVQGVAADPLVYKAVGPSTGAQTDIAFVDSNPDTITRGSGSFVDDGFWGDVYITISGSASNDASHTVVNVQATTLTLASTAELVAEGAGASVTITGQAKQGTSGDTEPAWPGVAGNRVVDGTVIWQAVTSDSITWEASSILTSGGSEPTWPTEAGAIVADNNIAWRCVPLRITDSNCPHTKVVAIAASKVFAGDTDVVRFCATLNARDWSTADDAGFIPSGLQQKSQVGVDAMGVYRGNLAIWSGSTFQMWMVDPDPAAMSLLDAMEGIGSIYQQAVQPVSDDCFFLSALGVRTVSIAEGANNLAAGDVGVPIDTLVQAEKDAVDVEPIATYFPGAGQYWLAFRPLSILAALLAGQFLLTTPPYPLEQIEYMELSCTLSGGSMDLIRSDSVDASFVPLDGTMYAIQNDLTAPNDEVDWDFLPLNGTMTTILNDIDVGNDELDWDFQPLNGTLEELLVTIRAPDEAIEFACTLRDGECSMTAV